MILNVKINKVTVVRISGADKIEFEFDGPSPFPELEKADPGDYPPYLRIECRRGYAEKWLAQIGITEFEVIEA